MCTEPDGHGVEHSIQKNFPFNTVTAWNAADYLAPNKMLH